MVVKFCDIVDVKLNFEDFYKKIIVFFFFDNILQESLVTITRKDTFLKNLVIS